MTDKKPPTRLNTDSLPDAETAFDQVLPGIDKSDPLVRSAIEKIKRDQLNLAKRKAAVSGANISKASKVVAHVIPGLDPGDPVFKSIVGQLAATKDRIEREKAGG